MDLPSLLGRSRRDRGETSPLSSASLPLLRPAATAASPQSQQTLSQRPTRHLAELSPREREAFSNLSWSLLPAGDHQAQEGNEKDGAEQRSSKASKAFSSSSGALNKGASGTAASGAAMGSPARHYAHRRRFPATPTTRLSTHDLMMPADLAEYVDDWMISGNSVTTTKVRPWTMAEIYERDHEWFMKDTAQRGIPKYMAQTFFERMPLARMAPQRKRMKDEIFKRDVQKRMGKR
eukprot:TRINITY_DN91480_c0_g1_i1.p1 TRINITY_DN91480_c0_g1~~TRINITY_DN91480_c0_g1_i1.p1  ORF type:complete len:235 (-),score=38.77 TRINITY_DN91480_c0_g1_i1:126-830(-)